MPLSVFDRVREITSTTGSGSITLGGAVSGFQSFNNVFDDGDRTYYTITNSNNWEVGLGTYTSGSFSRDQIFDSNNNGLPLSLSGTSYIFVTYPASKSVHKNLADEIPVGSAGLRFSDNTLQTTASTSLNKSYLNIASNTVASVSYDAYFVDSSSGSVQLTLPLASGNGGKQFVIKRIAGSNPVIVAGSGSDQIDGQSSYNIDFIYQSTTIISNNSSWYKI